MPISYVNYVPYYIIPSYVCTCLTLHQIFIHIFYVGVLSRSLHMFMLVPLFPSVYLPNLLFYILIWYACTVYTSFNTDLFRVDAAFSWYRTKSTRMITKNKLFVSNTFCIVNISLFLESSPYVGRIYTYIYIYTLYFMYTQIFNSPLKLTATLVMIPISFSIDYFTSTSDPTPRTWSASWLNLCMKQEIWWMGCLLGLGDMCVFPLIWWWYPQPKNTCQ